MWDFQISTVPIYLSEGDKGRQILEYICMGMLGINILVEVSGDKGYSLCTEIQEI